MASMTAIPKFSCTAVDTTTLPRASWRRYSGRGGNPSKTMRSASTARACTSASGSGIRRSPSSATPNGTSRRATSARTSTKIPGSLSNSQRWFQITTGGPSGASAGLVSSNRQPG